MKRERGSTIQRVLDILDTVAASPKPISATEINEVLNLPKATAHRLCSELEARGYLLKKINGKSYVPGNRLHDVAVGVLANSRLRATRHAILTSLSEKVGETCNIAYADGLYMAYSDRVEWQALPEHAAADQTQGGDRETTAGAPRQEYDYRSRNSDPGNR
jgi:DNA-binding IclR family transcriptional regulator